MLVRLQHRPLFCCASVSCSVHSQVALDLARNYVSLIGCGWCPYYVGFHAAVATYSTAGLKHDDVRDKLPGCDD
jgi:hypothetical protein